MSDRQTTAATAQASLDERLEKHKKDLVAWGDEIGERAKANRDWKSQGRILLDAASRETEPQVLRNLLRYQSTRNDNWLRPYEIVEEISRRIGECEDRAQGDRELAMEMIRHLLLYTLRAYTYHEAKRRAEERSNWKKNKKGRSKGGRRG